MARSTLLLLLCATCWAVSGAVDSQIAVSVAQAQQAVDRTLDNLRQNCAALPNTENAQAAQARRDLFAKRLQQLSVNIQQSTQTWTPGITCFTAMTSAERQRVLMQSSTVSKLVPPNATVFNPVNVSTSSVSTSQAAIAAIDWRSFQGRSFVSPIKDQGYCGSCYIFAPTAALESQMMINRLGGVSSGGAPKINLSEQQLVNCAPNVPFGRKQPYDPCDGGWPTVVYDWVRIYGLVAETSTPYIQFPIAGTWQTCVSKPAQYPNTVILSTGYKTVVDWFTPMSSDGNVNAIKAELLYGPLVIAFNANNAFMIYKKGVFSCTFKDSWASPNHAMLLVGWAPASGSTPAAWIIKNSWGTTWGESGFARVNMNPNSDCGLAKTFVQRATIRAVQG